MAKQIFFMHRSKFVCDAAVLFAKKYDVSCYTFERFEEFAYLINDLRPRHFFVELGAIVSDFEIFIKEVNKSDTRPEMTLMNIKSEEVPSELSAIFSRKINGDLDLNSLIQNLEA